MAKSGVPLVYYKRDDSSLEMDFFLRDAESLLNNAIEFANFTIAGIVLVGVNYYPMSWYRA